MLNPVVLPIPAALALLAFLAFVGRYLLESAAEWPVQPAASKGRHGLATAPASAYRPRPWDEATAVYPISAPPAVVPVIPGEIVEAEPVAEVEPEAYDLLDPRTPLAVVEARLTHLGFTDWYQANTAILAVDRELVAA